MTKQKGQTLVMFLIFMVIAITVTTGVILVGIANTKAVSGFDLGTESYYVAESGAENAILRLLRDPQYQGEIVPVGNYSAVISIVPGTPMKIISTGQVGNFMRKIEVQVKFIDGMLNINSWKEVY